MYNEQRGTIIQIITDQTNISKQKNPDLNLVIVGRQYVNLNNIKTIKNYFLKELNRDGQVYFVDNSVEAMQIWS